jgi:nicotinamidase/pyrazinamidase
MNKKALLIIDVQNDFCPEGALAVKDGDKVIPVINQISSKFDKVIATQDWHPVNHISFAKTHNKKVGEVINIDGIEQNLWPDHCVKNTDGAGLHKNLDLSNIDLILKKGMDKKMDSYSAFLENDKITSTGLEYYLKGLDITDIYLTGLATDYCVFYSAIDAINCGFKTFLVIDATKGVDIPENNLSNSLKIMDEKGVKKVTSNELF